MMMSRCSGTRRLVLHQSQSQLLQQQRHRSNKSAPPHLIEIDLDSDSSSSVIGGVRKLEDVIHSIIVRRSAPDWLPFLPGSSYWVPPHPTSGVSDILGKIAGPLGRRSRHDAIRATLAFSSPPQGWPSSSYYLQGSSIASPDPVEVQVVEVKFQEDSDNESRSEDEER